MTTLQEKICSAYGRHYSDTGEPPRHVYLGYDEFKQFTREMANKPERLTMPDSFLGGPIVFDGLMIHQVHERNHFNVA